MSRIIANNIRHNDATSDNITLDGSNNVTTANNFTAGGTIGCTGDLTVTSGNLVLSSGNGIDFSAAGNAGGMTSELLDDYEEGDWTPVVKIGGTTVSASEYNSGAKYTKIGRLVYVAVTVASIEKGSLTGSVEIQGLPFSTTAGYPAHSGVMRWDGISTDDGTIVPYFTGTTISLQKFNASTGFYGAVEASNCATSINLYFMGGWYATS